jgi:protein-S-isoprenylcysteine O-methyltransferase Ste14
MRWKWKNIPIPEAHVVGLVLGAIMQAAFSQRLFRLPWIGDAFGWPLILIGIGLSVWSVFEAREMDIESPLMLLTSGPYALSRNPMYVGWSLIYLGIAFAANSVWIIALFPAAFAYIHFVDIPREEQLLQQQFDQKYLEYQKRVRRYL